MAEERDEEEFGGTEGSGKNPQTTGQQGQQSEFGQQGQQPTGSSGSEPPRSMGTKGTEFGQFGESKGESGQQGQSGTGQADLGSQADTTLSGRTDQQDLGTDQPGRTGGAEGEGFIGSQGTGSDEYLRKDESGSSSDSTGGSDFAEKGQGATDEEEDESGSTGGSGGSSF